MLLLCRNDVNRVCCSEEEEEKEKEEKEEEEEDCFCHCHCHCRHCHEDYTDEIVRADTSVNKHIVMKRMSIRRGKRRRRGSRGRGDCGYRIANIHSMRIAAEIILSCTSEHSSS